jgi:hypothetical protein
MAHDRIHARPPHDPEHWRVGTVRAVTERDGHAVFTVEPDGAATGDRAASGDVTAPVDLVVTLAVRDLVVRRLEAADPVGRRVWFRQRGQ